MTFILCCPEQQTLKHSKPPDTSTLQPRCNFQTHLSNIKDRNTVLVVAVPGMESRFALGEKYTR